MSDLLIKQTKVQLDTNGQQATNNVDFNGTSSKGKTLLPEMYEALKIQHQKAQQKNEMEISRYNRELAQLYSQKSKYEQEINEQKKRIKDCETEKMYLRAQRDIHKNECSLIMKERHFVLEENNKHLDTICSLKSKLNTLNNHQPDPKIRSSSNGPDKVEGLMDQLTKTKQKLVEVVASHDQMVRECHNLEKVNQQLLKEKKEAEKVAEDQKRWREMAFHERDKRTNELTESKLACEKLSVENERLIKQLEEAVKEHDVTRTAKNKLQSDLKKMQARLLELLATQPKLIDGGNHDNESGVDVYECMTSQDAEVGVEAVVMVTHSTIPEVKKRDFILEIDRKPTATMTSRDLQKALSPEKSHLLRIQRDSKCDLSTSIGSSVSIDNAVISKTKRLNHLRMLLSRSQFNGIYRVDPPATSPLSNQQQQSPSNQQPPETTFHKSLDDRPPIIKKRKSKVLFTNGWFTNRKKKSKSVLISTGSEKDAAHRTWPRSDANSLCADQFTSNDENNPKMTSRTRTHVRPILTSDIFIPPDSSKPCRSDSLKRSQRKTDSPLEGNKTRLRSKIRDGSSPRKLRPTSAPIEAPINLSMWPQDIDLDHVTKFASPEASVTSRSSIRDNKKSRSKPKCQVSKSDRSLPLTSPVVVHKRHPNISSGTLPIPINRQQSVPNSSLMSLEALPLLADGSQTMPAGLDQERVKKVAWNHHYYKTAMKKHGLTRQKMSRDYPRVKLPGSRSISPNCSNSTISNVTIESSQSSPFMTLVPKIIPDSSVGSLVSNSSSSMSSRSRPQVSTDPRSVVMVKGPEPIGISISGGCDSGGIFISHLTENSLAAKAGIEYGDQLLEFNGINLRNAKEEQARVIMGQSQPGDTITFLVQYNFKKYKVSIESNLSDTLGLPQPKLRHTKPSKALASVTNVNDDREGTITPDVTPRASAQIDGELKCNQPISEQQRYIALDSDFSGEIKLSGGNQKGIFISYIKDAKSGDEDHLKLRMGDRLIQYNNTKFVNITLEEASIMISRSSVNRSFVVQHDRTRFFETNLQAGDHFFVRALFDCLTPREGCLTFVKNSILLVENTLPDYNPGGYWVACLLDELGEPTTCGRIPSKIAVEKDSSNFGNDDNQPLSSKRLSGSGRRSFFKRRSKPNRTSSRSSGDYRVPRSTSETSVESAVIDASLDGSTSIHSYQVVEKHSSSIRRPVVVFGPHSGSVVERLSLEFSPQFFRITPDHLQIDPLNPDIIETYTNSGSSFALTGSNLKTKMQENSDRHVLVDVSVETIRKLHAMQIYPIIVFIKYRDPKKVKLVAKMAHNYGPLTTYDNREAQDKTREKLSTKQCKEMLEKANHIENKLNSGYYSIVTVTGAPSSVVVAELIKMISREHSKVLWLPGNSDLLNYSL